MSDIQIRSYQPSDEAKIISLVGELQIHEGSLQPSLQSWKNCKETMWAWLQSNIEKKSGFILLAEDKKGVVGLLIGWMDEDSWPGINKTEKKFGYISELVVNPGARRKGAGAALMNAAEDIFLKRGVTIMRLTAYTNNELADNFYLKYGMNHYITTYKKHLTDVA